MAVTHEHQWKLSLHMDGCHWFRSSYACECGATANSYTERDFKEDPYSMIWAEPQVREVNRDEKGRFIKKRWETVICDRCVELQNGAEPIHDVIITEAE